VKGTGVASTATLLICVGMAHAQPSATPTPQVTPPHVAPPLTLRAVPLQSPLRLDGRLDEDVYSSVPPISEFIQSLPKEGAPASERTEAWVLFDADNMYVSARCWDSAPPEQWVANELRRDTNQLRQNDTFGVMFDTFHDHRNGFVFYTNPLGARYDFAFTDEGNVNPDWNQVWDVRTGRFDGGWTMEMAIPFKSLRYRSGTEEVWGLQLRRVVRRKNEFDYITLIPMAVGFGGISRASEAATLMGLQLPKASRNLEIKPYGISSLTTDRVRTPAVVRDPGATGGVDVKYGITANLTADFTYNTDFAQVEVDEQQVNLTRFNLFFPEKREFFLENRGILDFGRAPAAQSTSAVFDVPSLYYSRRIGLSGSRTVPVDAGGRVTGKIGDFAVGMMHLQTGDLPPAAGAPTGGSAAIPTTGFTVLRLRRDVLRRSNIGAMFTNRSRSATGRGSNQAYGVDALFALYRNVSLSGYLAQTQNENVDRDNTSARAAFDYTGDRYGVNLHHARVGQNFNPEVGFVRRRNFKRSFAMARFSPRPERIDFVRKFTYEGSFDYVLNGFGQLESRELAGRFNTELENSDQFTVQVSKQYELLIRPFPIASTVTLPVGGYHFNDVQVSYGFGQQRRASGTASAQLGQFYDGTIAAFGYTGARVSLLKPLSVEPTVTLNWVRLPAGDFTQKLFRARTDYAFSPRMFVSALVQYSSVDTALSSNLRFRWEYHPGSELFIVYTDERETIGTLASGLRNQAVVVKVTRLFRF